jgi:hypothetical protein
VACCSSRPTTFGRPFASPRPTGAPTASALRYLEWTYDPDPADSTYTVEYAYVLRDSDGDVQVEHDRHVEGLFSREVWMRLIEEAGFEPQAVTFPQSIHGAPLELFVGRRPL